MVWRTSVHLRNATQDCIGISRNIPSLISRDGERTRAADEPEDRNGDCDYEINDKEPAPCGQSQSMVHITVAMDIMRQGCIIIEEMLITNSPAPM